MKLKNQLKIIDDDDTFHIFFILPKCLHTKTKRFEILSDNQIVQYKGLFFK